MCQKVIALCVNMFLFLGKLRRPTVFLALRLLLTIGTC